MCTVQHVFAIRLHQVSRIGIFAGMKLVCPFLITRRTRHCFSKKTSYENLALIRIFNCSFQDNQHTQLYRKREAEILWLIYVYTESKSYKIKGCAGSLAIVCREFRLNETLSQANGR